MPSAPKDVQLVYQLNWGAFCTLMISDFVTIFTCLDLDHAWVLIAYLLLDCAGNQLQQTTIIIVKYPLVGEQIRG
jgi:hypothetical protein